MKKTKLFFGIALSTVTILTSCGGESKEVEKITTITSISANAEDTLVDKTSRFQGEAHSGQFVFKTDSVNQYAATVKYDLNDSLINSNLRLIVNFWAKTSTPLKGDGLAISFQDNEQVLVWANIDPIAYGAKPNEWINIIDSVTVPADKVAKSGLFYKIFAFNANKKATMYVDDINITIKKVETVVE